MAGRRFDRIGWAMAQEDLSSPQKFVLVVLADAANEDEGVCWLKHATIAERTALGVTTVRHALAALIELGLVRNGVRYDRTGRQTSNLYQLGCYESVAEGVRSGHPGVEVEDVRSEQGEVSAPSTSIVNRPEGLNQLHGKTSSSRRASRRGRRAAADGEGLKGDTSHLWREAEADAADGPDGHGERISRTNPNSAFGLAKYWGDACLMKGWLTGRKTAIVRKHMAAWLKVGASPDVIRAMVDLFVADPQFAETDHRWKRFIANSESLQARVLQSKPALRATPDEDEPQQRLPQWAIDAMLDEAEEVA